MGIVSRLSTLLRANINDLASRAENPELVLNQLILDMEDQFQAARRQVRDTIADRKKLEKDLDSSLEKSREWERRAMVAVKAGEDDLARQALERKQEIDHIATEQRSMLEGKDQAVEDLKRALKGLEKKIDEARKKKSLLLARKKRVEMTNKMSANPLDGASAFENFERQAARVEDLEAEAEAAVELSDSIRPHELESKFRKLEEGGAGGAEDALAALKEKMGYDD